MSDAVFHKLGAILFTVALGYIAGRRRWLSPQGDPARVLGDCAFALFVPALLFRTMVRVDFAALPWRTVAAFFVPVLAVLAAVYAVQRVRQGGDGERAAVPAVRAFSMCFGNSVQVGIPVAAALFGEGGLGLHLALVSLHALVLLSVATALVEWDLARARGQGERRASTWATLRSTVRNTVVHPVVMPVLAGIGWHFTGLGLHPVADEGLQLLGSAVVPVCLLLIGLTLAQYGLRSRWRGAVALAAMKLLVLPALVLGVARGAFGISGVALSVVVMMAAMPVGANPLIFAQRYRTLEDETTAAIVVSTFAFALTAPLWLALLAWLGG